MVRTLSKNNFDFQFEDKSDNSDEFFKVILVYPNDKLTSREQNAEQSKLKRNDDLSTLNQSTLSKKEIKRNESKIQHDNITNTEKLTMLRI